MKKQLLILAMMLLQMVASIKALAHDFGVANADGKTIYYVYNNGSSGTTVSVSYRGSDFDSYSNEYSGDIVIPKSVTYNAKTYSVTSIGESAFRGCSGLTSITIPNSVTSIGWYAFEGCSGLTSITIPNSVTSIGGYAFSSCSGLTSITIPNSVTSIGDYVFQICSSLTSITIPNSVTSIGNYAFRGCSGLNSITITNSVTSIGERAFYGCSGLTSVYITDLESWCKIAFKDDFSNPLYYAYHLFLNGEEIKDLVIPTSVTSIGDLAFSSCSGLTSVTIPNSVTSIGWYAFRGCSGLTSITIGNSVTSIGESAFEGCSGLLDMFCYAENVPTTGSDAFEESNIANATLHVPAGSVGAYQAADQWKNFKEIVEIVPEKCATPTIKYIGGKLKFECETEGIEFVYSITTPTNTIDQTGNDVEMPHTNNVSVYAKKEGYLNSDVATANIDVRGIQGDVNQDGVVSIADAVNVINIIMKGETAAPAMDIPQELERLQSR